MYAIWCNKRRAYKTYEGWTKTTHTPKAVTMDGIPDCIRFTAHEAELNADRLPKGQSFRHIPGPIKWSDFK